MSTSMDVTATDVPDMNLNSVGARGIGITGTDAAVGKAIFDATGERVRDRAITPDKLL
jgi:CO/xanthine dehydrogenase Mo-binding subunit